MCKRRWRASFRSSSTSRCIEHQQQRGSSLTGKDHMIDVVMPQMGESIVEGTLTNG